MRHAPSQIDNHSKLQSLIYLGHEDTEEKATLESLAIMMREVQITVNTILAKMTENVPLPPFSSRDDLVKFNQLAKVIPFDSGEG